MPFSGISSFLPTIDEFSAHWAQADAAAPDAIALAGSYDVTNLAEDRTAMAGILTTQEDLDNLLQIKQALRDQRRAALLERITQLRKAVEIYIKDSPYGKTLPDKPGRNAGPAIVMKALDDAASGWTQINSATIPGFNGPLLLRAGYSLANFKADAEILRGTYPELTTAESDAALNRKKRVALYEKVRGHLIDYRKAMELHFDESSPIRQTVPLLTPPAGSAPDAPAATASWDAAAEKARIVVAAVTDAKVSRLQLRTSPDSPYSADSERVVKTQPVGELLFLTDDGLTAPGSEARYRVYALTASGNETAGEVLEVARPE